MTIVTHSQSVEVGLSVRPGRLVRQVEDGSQDGNSDTEHN